MTGGTWRVVTLGLVVAGLALGYLGVELGRLLDGDPLGYAMDMGAVLAGVVALWFVLARLNRHFRDLERLRDALTTRRRGAAAVTVAFAAGEIGRLAETLGEVLRRDHGGADHAGDRLAAVISALEEPVLVLDDRGRVAVLNPAAGFQLGLAVGDDVYDHLSRPDLFRAIERTRESGQVAAALVRRAQGAEVSVRVRDLGLHGGGPQAGVALVFPARADGAPLQVTDRGIALRPSASARAPHLGDDEPLLTLPLVSLWVATTDPGAAPDAENVAVVAVGTVRLAGPRVFRTLCLDLFVDPGRPIPAAATAVHGVTDSMVAGARPFGAAWPVVAEALHGCVVVGVGVVEAFDRLTVAARHAGLPEPERPPMLDLGRLAAALDGPALEGASLDRLAAAFGIVPDPRIGVFSPPLVEAELAAALLLRLDARGVSTHGAARALTVRSGNGVEVGTVQE